MKRLLENITIVFLLISSIIGFTLIYINWDVLRNEAIVSSHTQTTKTEDEIKLDYYGRKCLISIATIAIHTTTTLVSAGRDGIFDTSDDILKYKVNYNKSRIIGRWVGRKSKQFGKGLIEGLQNEN